MTGSQQDDAGAELPAYDELAAVLSRCPDTGSPAEAQGLAVGLWAADVNDAERTWRRELYAGFDPADVLTGECRALLDRVFANVFREADPATAQLTLLLPQDVVVDSTRLAALRDWCQGFLFGIGLGGEAFDRGLSAQARDLLRDVGEFTRLDTGDVENSSENQSALIEIEEYLRVGALLIRDETYRRHHAADVAKD